MTTTTQVRITTDGLNSYGTRILTAGMDVEQYRRNPVLLYQHMRGEVIGYVDDIEVLDGQITGRLQFDEASELSQQCKRQWEFGSLRMVSVGIDVLETSADPALLVPGQVRPTVTRSRLFEVSLVDIGANDDAIRLTHQGRPIELTSGADCPLPLMHTTKTTTRETNNMNEQQFAALLGLDTEAKQAEIEARAQALLSAEAQLREMEKEHEEMRLQAIATAVDAAIQNGQLLASARDQMLALGQKVGLDDLSQLLAQMPARQKLSDMIAPGADGTQLYKRLSEVPEDKLMELRAKQPAEYRRLYKAEYGIECQID